MSKILNFFASIFNPRGLKNYRNMSAIIALMVFLLEINLLYLPIKGVLLNNVDKSLDNNAYTIVFNNIEDTFNKGIEGIKNSDYYIKEEQIENEGTVYNVFKMKTKDSNEEIKIYDYEFTFKEKSFIVHYIFDVNGTADKETEEIYNRVKLACPEKNELSLTYMSMLIYADKPVDDDAFNARVSFYAALTEAKLEETLNALSYFDYYGINKKENSYIMLFLGGSFLVEVPSAQEGLYARMSSNYDGIELNMENIKNISEFSKLFSHKIGEVLAEEESVYYFGTCLMYVLLFPIIMAGILNLCLKNRGCLNSFKEFYNVLSMVSIVPAILGFVVTFFIGTGGVMIYAAALSIYGIFMVYKTMKIVE